MDRNRRVRIFLSSPGDVQDERERAVRVIEKVQAGLGQRVTLTPVIWEEGYYTAGSDFQSQIPLPSETDLVVCVLWEKLGSLLPPRYNRPDGSARTGTEWEFEEALGGASQKGVPDILVYRKTAELRCSPAELAKAQTDYQYLEAFWTRWFHNEQGHFTAGFQYFATTDEFEAAFEEHLRQWLTRRAGEVVWPIDVLGSPFRGLEAFDAGHAPVFFGRYRAIEETRARLVTSALRGCAFLLVTGMSGAGKSSLVRAGLGPRLMLAGSVPGVDRWRRAVMRPGGRADGPLAALADCLFVPEALPELAEGDCPTPPDLAAFWRDAPAQALRPLGRAVDRIAQAIGREEGFDRPVAVRCLLLLDQLEELFQYCEEARNAFAAVIDRLGRDGRFFVVATLRGDFYQSLKGVPLLWQLKDDGGQYTLSPPGPAEIREIIQGPGQAAGLTFECDEASGEHLADWLERGAGGPGSLPLLQFTLEQLFVRRDQDKKLLRLEAYKEMGGMEGAISTHADAVFEALDQQARQALPRLLLALTTVRPDNPETVLARPASQSALDADAATRRLVEAFVAPEARLLVSDGEGEAVTLRVAHEALFTHWDKARACLGAVRPALQARARLGQAAAMWAAEGRRDDLLVSSAAFLAEAARLFAQHGLELAPLEREFLEKSRAGVRRATRLRRAAVAALAALTVASLIGLWVSVVQFRRAEGQRERAERQKELALEAVNRLTFDLPEAIGKFPGMLEIARGLFENNVALLDRILAQEPDTPAAERHKAANFTKAGDIWVVLGDTAKARNSYTKALAIAKQLAASDSQNTERQRDLSVSHNKIGNVLQTTGDMTGALEAYKQGLIIAERLAESDPKNTDWQRDLSVSHEKIGDVLLNTGDTDGALEAYKRSMEIRQRLAASDPQNTQWQRDLSVSHNKIGDVLRVAGDTAGALEAYKQSMEIRQRLAASDPRNTAWQRDLSVSHNRIGDVLRVAGDSAGALEAYKQDLIIAERLAESDPQNTQWQHDLSISHERIGNVLQASGDTAGALEAYKKSMEIRQRLAASDPRNTDWQRDLSVSHNRIGDVLRVAGDSAGALEAYKQDLIIAERLAASDPQNTDWQRGLSVSHTSIGDVLQITGDTAGAYKAYEQAISISKELAASDPRNTDWQRVLSVHHEKIGNVLQDSGDTDGALAAYKQSMEIRQRLAASDPQNTEWQRDLSVSHNNIGDVLQTTGDIAGALAAYRQALTIAERLAESDPQNTQWQRDLTVSHSSIGNVLQTTGDMTGALEAYKQGLVFAERLADSDPHNTQWQRDLSVSHSKIGNMLRASGDTAGALAAYKQGLIIAERLAASDPKNTQWQRDLSVSHYKISRIDLAVGRRAEALAHLEQGLAIMEPLARKDPQNAQWRKDINMLHREIDALKAK